jgi:hypothetical protein
LSPALKNASIAALVAVLAITAVTSLMVGASTTSKNETDRQEEMASGSMNETDRQEEMASGSMNETDRQEEMASGSMTESTPPENTQVATANVSPVANPEPVAPEIKNTIEPIKDPGKLAELREALYNKVDNAWRETPVNADSKYRVRVTEKGEIAEYEPTNQEAVSNTNNTPLPDLVVANSPAAGDSPTMTYAEFEVIFNTNNSLKVNIR